MHAAPLLAHTFPPVLPEWMSCVSVEGRLAAGSGRLAVNVGDFLLRRGHLDRSVWISE